MPPQTEGCLWSGGDIAEQVLLSITGLTVGDTGHERSGLRESSLVVPFVLSAASLLNILARSTLARVSLTAKGGRGQVVDSHGYRPSAKAGSREHVAREGADIFRYRLLRFVVCLALVWLSAITFGDRICIQLGVLRVYVRGHLPPRINPTPTTKFYRCMRRF